MLPSSGVGSMKKKVKRKAPESEAVKGEVANSDAEAGEAVESVALGDDAKANDASIGKPSKLDEDKESDEVFACDVCGKEYETLAEAEACEAACLKKLRRPYTEEEKAAVSQVFVGGVPSSTTEEQIRQFFQKSGKIEAVTQPCKRAFIVFKSEDDARRATEELDGTKLGAGTLKVFIKDPLPPGVSRRRKKSGPDRRDRGDRGRKGKGKGKGKR